MQNYPGQATSYGLNLEWTPPEEPSEQPDHDKAPLSERPPSLEHIARHLRLIEPGTR